jgi:hypothetical protein
LDAALFIAGDNDATRALNTTLAEVSGKLAQNDKPRAEALGRYVQAHLAEWKYFQLQSTRKKQPMALRQAIKSEPAIARERLASSGKTLAESPNNIAPQIQAGSSDQSSGGDQPEKIPALAFQKAVA